MSNHQQQWPKKKRQQGYGEFLCKPCNTRFVSFDRLMKHKGEKRKAGSLKHIHCRLCGIDFKTEREEHEHIQEIHPCQKDLGCPGCGLGPFDRPSNLIRHFEDGSCLRISWSTIEELREKKLQFAKGLQQLTQDTVKNHYSQFMPSTAASDGALCVQVWDDELLVDQNQHSGGKEISTDKVEPPVDKEAEPWGVQPFHVKDEEFPGLPSRWNKENTTPANASSRIGAQTTDREGEEMPAWTMKKNLFPNARPAVAPTGEQLAAATAPGERMMYEAMDRDHPNHPNFDVERFYVEVNENYSCPRVRCYKTFPSGKGLVAHLKSPYHSDKTYRCPVCLKKFQEASAIAAHMESKNSKCQIRDGPGYGAYLDQLTGGIIDVSEDRNEVGGLIYKTSEAAREMFNKGKEEVKKIAAIPGANW